MAWDGPQALFQTDDDTNCVMEAPVIRHARHPESLNEGERVPLPAETDNSDLFDQLSVSLNGLM